MQVDVAGVCRGFVENAVLRGCSVSLTSGDTCAITGVSGSGKSTLLQIIAGMDRPDAGSVHWDGTDLYACSQARRNRLFQRTVGWLSQAPLLDPQGSTLDNCLLPTVFQPVPQARERAHDLLTRVALGDQLALPAQALSGGQQVRCALARALVHRPRLVIADEPTGTLDAATAGAVANLLLDLAREEGFTLLLATHDQSLAARCQHHLHLEGGLLAPAAAVLA
jgi:putative ABC transport system ATP-binding protein